MKKLFNAIRDFFTDDLPETQFLKHSETDEVRCFDDWPLVYFTSNVLVEVVWNRYTQSWEELTGDTI